MYSSDFGVVSDGQLHNMQQELMKRNEQEEASAVFKDQPSYRDRDKGFLSSLLSDIKTDDLILIALGVLLLLDGKGDNDLLAVILIVLFLL